MDSPSKITKIKLKRCEKSHSSDARALAKISCKIGDHLVHAYINSGSSISIASVDLYRQLVADKCTFRDGIATLNLIDESIPNQEYRVTTTTVKVIGKSKSINLVTFPDLFTQRTVLGMDFLATKSVWTSKDDVVFRVPERPAPKSNPIRSVQINDEDQPIALLDWILDTKHLKKPLYNILADGTADDDDLFAICAFMKRLPRMVSPIRSFDELFSCTEKQVDTESTVTSFDKVDRAVIAPDWSSSKNPSITPDTPASLTALSDVEVVSLSTNHDTTTSQSSIPSTIPLDKPIEEDMSLPSKSPTSILVTASLDKAKEEVIDSSSKNEATLWKTSAKSKLTAKDKADEKDISIESPTNTAQTPKPSTTSLDKMKEKDINSSSKNQTTTPRTLASLEKEKERILSLLLKDQTTPAKTSTPSATVSEKAKEKIMSSWSKNRTETSVSSKPSRTSLYNAKEKDKSSSSRNSTITSRTSTSSTISLDRAREKGISSSSKNPTTTSTRKSTLSKEDIKRSTTSSNTYRRASLSKSGRH